MRVCGRNLGQAILTPLVGCHLEAQGGFDELNPFAVPADNEHLGPDGAAAGLERESHCQSVATARGPGIRFAPSVAGRPRPDPVYGSMPALRSR